jgi:hypothetical protein
MKKLKQPETWILIIFIIAIAAFFWSLTGCTTEKEISKILQQYCKGSTETNKDSTNTSVTTLTPQDSTFYLSMESIMNAYIECLNGRPVIVSVDTIYQDNHIITSLNMNGNSLLINTKVDSAEVVARWNEKHTTNTTTVNTDQKEKVIITTNVLTKEQTKWISMGKWSIAVYIILFLLLIIYLILRYRNKLTDLITKLKK